jgi:hypothetical protein
MERLELTDEDIQHIVLVGRRFLINESTHPGDLKVVLMERLREAHPDLAEKIEAMSRHEMVSLCRTMLKHQQSNA